MLQILAIILLAVSFTICAIITSVVQKLSLNYDFVCRPTRDRFHRITVPLGGGIAIFTTIAFILLMGIISAWLIIAPGHLNSFLGESVTVHCQGFLDKIPSLLITLFCIAALFTLGLIDDMKKLGPYIKLTAQFVISLIAAAFGAIRVEFFIHNQIITSLLSAFWIVLIINCFNFLDNMDGASTGIAVIASAILLIAAAISGQIFIGAMAILFIGTLLGFLAFNFPPASIFMGDCGSLIVGFIVALLTLRTTYFNEALSGKWYPVLMPLIVMAVPLYDFISVTILRISQGKSPFVGDTQHFSHRLCRRGLTETQTVLTLYLATLVTGLGATFLYQVSLMGAILIFVQTILILAIIAILESTSI